ncbi:MAG: LysR family transcriptional regulator [Saprospiraceae bacterium]|nr:LysR family transcriptional regulator [Saprospiraceae bacterium]
MSNQLELRHIRYFLAVADELHFRKAADKLYISQPGLSRQIKQMEEDLQLKLFERHNRKVKLTASGSFLKNEFIHILKSIEGALSHAHLLEKGYQGQLTLGYIGSAMQTVIPDFLLNIRKAFPGIRFDLKEMDNKSQIDGISNQEIDLGFIRMDRVPRDLEMRPVFEDTFSLVLPKDHPIDRNNYQNLTQLKDEPFILFDASYSTSYYEKVMHIFDQAGFVPIISHKTVQANTIYRLIEKKFGVAIVPTSLQNGYDLNIKFIELDTLPFRTTLQAIWSKKNKNPLLENTLQFI